MLLKCLCFARVNNHLNKILGASLGEPILIVDSLVASFQTEQGRIRALDGVDLSIHPGETLGLVGESGSGKSVTSLSIMGLLPRPSGRIDSGKIMYRGQDLCQMTPSEKYRLRGHKISMIFQEPMTALNPVKTIGKQMLEVYELHRQSMARSEQWKDAVSILGEVGISSPEQRMAVYPHQLSGGMRQRAMIAMALAAQPELLIADEPTTALDVTIQAQILDLLRDIQAKRGMAILFITHDLGVVADLCDRVAVMYGGRVVEYASVSKLFHKPSHPYTRGLLGSIPSLDLPAKQRLQVIPGMVPPLHEMPSGCRFNNRCHWQTELCQQKSPELKEQEPGHQVRCFHWQEMGEHESNP